MTSPEASITFDPRAFGPDGEVADDSVRGFLANFMQEFHDHLVRVLTALPRS